MYIREENKAVYKVSQRFSEDIPSYTQKSAPDSMY